MLRRAYLEGILGSAEWVAARARYHQLAPGEAQRLGTLCADLRRDLAAFERSVHTERLEIDCGVPISE